MGDARQRIQGPMETRPLSVELRPYAAGDEAAILDLFERSFGKPMSSAFWRWRFLDNPTDGPMIDLAWDGDILAAHYAVSPMRVAVAGEQALGALSMTTMTHPDYRGRGLFVQLAATLYERLAAAGYALVWGFPNAQSHRSFVRDLAWTDVHEIPSLRLDRSRWAGIPAAPLEEVTASAPVLDAIWDRCRELRRLLVWRDTRYLAWRYGRHPENAYRIVVADGGYAVFKRFGDEVDLVDVLVADDDPGVLRMLIGGVLAVQADALAINTWTPLGSTLHLELERLGFVATSPVTYLGARRLDPRLPDVGDVRDWHYAMGDSDVF